MTLNKTGLRLGLDEITARASRAYVSCPASLRLVVTLFLMMVVGVNSAWGQTVDYSGTYYIASKGYDGNPNNTNNYYLCPTEGWIYYKATDSWDTNGSTYPNPFLTTYQCKKDTYHSGDPSNAVWIIEKHPTQDYYYIKHKSDGKYMVSNGQISGSSNANRMRVHLEEVAEADLDDKALFAINPYSQTLSNVVYSYLTISPKSEDGWNKGQTVDNRVQDLKYYSVNNGNQPYYNQGNTKTDGPGGRATGGIIGVYTENDQNAQFYFEDVITRPTITCNTSNQISITAAQSGTVTIKYTTDGTKPSADNGETYSETFELAEGVITIKAITIGTDWVSNVATFTNHKRLIQSQNNAWNTTDFHFYMIPRDEASGITKVNTTSLFRPSMEWTIQSASVERGIHYYYIINNANNKYLCYDATNIVYMDDFGSGDNKFKFFMKESSRYPGTFHIIPYGLNILVSKNNGNTSADAINTVGNNINSNAISENAHWKFVLPSELNTDAPFTVSDASTHITKYYKIASVGSNGYYIIPPTGNNTNATTSNSSDADVIKSGIWIFEQAQAADASDWCTYYYIRNAETREYLYFTQDVNNKGACLEMRSTIDVGNEDRYMFTWAKTADATANYYIVPKLLKDASQNQISSLRKGDNTSTTISTNVTRGAGNFAWTFAPALFCEPPVFTESAGSITLSCITPGAEIYYTTDGTEPTSSSSTYSGAIASPTGTDQMVIRAIGVVSDANLTPSTASSDVTTLLYNPDITLDPNYNYSYDGTGKEPSATVSITKGNNTVTAPSTAYTVNYSNNTDARLKTAQDPPTATLVDVPGDNWYIWGNELSQTFTIEPAALSLTVSIEDWTYGADAREPEVTGAPEGSEIIYGYKVRDAGDDTYITTKPTKAGKYTIRVIIEATGNNGRGEATKDFEIKKATLTVTGTGSKAYKSPEPNPDPDPLPYTVTGLASGDTTGEVLTGKLSRKSGEVVGEYAITQGTLKLNTANEKAANYTLNFAGGTFRITGTNITVTLSMEGWVYGEEEKDPSSDVTFPSDYPKDEATVTYYYKTKGTSDSNYSQEKPSDAGNYTVKVVVDPYISYEGGSKTKDFTITKASLTITADAITKGYHDEDPELTYEITGLKYNQTPDAVLKCELQRAEGETIGDYAITEKTTSTLLSSNYQFTNPRFVDATFTITKKKLGDDETKAPTKGISIYTEKSDANAWTVKVYQGNNELTQGTDYTFDSGDGVSYDAEKGLYTVSVNGSGNYEGTAKVSYSDCGDVFYAIDDGGENNKKITPYISTDQDLTTSADLVPCIVGQVNPSVGTISIIPISYVPEDVPVLLLAPASVTGITTSPKNAATPAISESVLNNNKLNVAPEDGVTVEATEAYMYYKGEFVLTTAGTIKKDNYYLYNPNYKVPDTPGDQTGSVRSLRILMDGTTGLLDLQSVTDPSPSEGTWHTLDGRLLNRKPSRKGLYINSGKKVAVK